MAFSSNNRKYNPQNILLHWAKSKQTRKLFFEEMKIVTWNVNGIRSFDKKWKETLISLDADIICVQETKVTSNFSELIIL